MRPIGPAFAFVLLIPASAAGQDAISVDLVAKAQVGSQPKLVIKTHSLVLGVEFDAKRSVDGKKVEQKTGPLDPGQTREFPLELDRPGKSRFVGELRVDLGKGATATMPIDVEVELMGELEVKVRSKDVDLAGQKLFVRSSRPLQRVQISVMSETGVLLGTSETKLDPPAGHARPAAVTWQQKGQGKVMRITVRGHDVNGFFGDVDIFPWRLDIPHEEVNFASGSHVIEKEETHKLERSYDLLVDAISDFGKHGKLRLFIAGHTDSVGTTGYNFKLSRNRARSIGRWFRKAGIRIPILYAGFGESQLLVDTPDETDELSNRRAEYIVSVDEPTTKANLDIKWRPLD